MKTTNFIRTIFILVAMICISGISSYAAKPELAPAIHLQKVIQQSLTYPEQAVKNCCTGTVRVIFAIDESGKIDIKKMSADNMEIADAVKEQLLKINYKDANAPFYQLYKITISFKLLG